MEVSSSSRCYWYIKSVPLVYLFSHYAIILLCCSSRGVVVDWVEDCVVLASRGVVMDCVVLGCVCTMCIVHNIVVLCY